LLGLVALVGRAVYVSGPGVGGAPEPPPPKALLA